MYVYYIPAYYIDIDLHSFRHQYVHVRVILVNTDVCCKKQVDFNISVLGDEHGTADERALVAELALQNISDEALLVALNGALSSEGPRKRKKTEKGRVRKPRLFVFKMFILSNTIKMTSTYFFSV